MLAADQQRPCDSELETLRQLEPSLRSPLKNVQEIWDFNEPLTEATTEALVHDLTPYGSRTLNLTVKAAARRTRHHKECTLDEVVGQIKEWLRRARKGVQPGKRGLKCMTNEPLPFFLLKKAAMTV
ncbi:hypothetical protein MTO96_012578 [Rhipicephalus appendiculatus]